MTKYRGPIYARPMGTQTPKSTKGTYSLERRSWLRAYMITVTLYRRAGSFLGLLPEGSDLPERYADVIPDEYGDDINIVFQGTGGKAFFSIYLTEMTEEELHAFRDYIVSAISQALPIVQKRDELAEEANSEYGDDSHPRVYRDIPAVHFRPGEKRRYDESLRRGLEGAAAMVGSELLDTDRVRVVDPGRTRGGGQRLPARDPFDAERGHGTEEAVDVPGVGEEGGEDELPF